MLGLWVCGKYVWFDYYGKGNFVIEEPNLRHRKMLVPWWYWMAYTAIFPALWARRYLVACYRRRHFSNCALNQKCVKCGYDLRASQGRCPECGASIPTIHAAPSPKEKTGGSA